MLRPMKILFVTSVILATCFSNASAEEKNQPLSPGLIANFQDTDGRASEVVTLPEIGLNAGESPHPAIKPTFDVYYEGYIEVAQAGHYRFETNGVLTISGKEGTGERELNAGKHPLLLVYRNQSAPLQFGLSWQSEHFIKEPMPPSVYWHEASQSANLATAYAKNRTYPSPPHRIRESLEAMKCASCHDAVFLGTMHHKFAPDSLLTLMRHANTPKFYGALTGPLLEENATLTQLASDLQKLPHGDRVRGTTAADPNSAKSMVGSQAGLACIACHDLLHHKTEAESKGPNLALIRDRVSYDWFVRWMSNPQRLKPGVPMPAFFAGQEADKQQKSIDALWGYLSQGQQMELPDELRVNPNQFVLKPTSRPLFTRAYIVLSDGRELRRAICIGLPNGVSYCFDAETCQLAYVWTGGFLDMAPHWQNQSGMPTPAVGTPFFLQASGEGLRIGEHQPKFQGYEMIRGIPRFEFLYGETLVRLLIDAPNLDQVRQTYTIGKRAEPIRFVGPRADAPVSATASSGTWSDQTLTVEDKADVELVIRLERKK